MLNEQTYKVIEIIKNMDEKDKLRLAICMNYSIYTNICYDKNEMTQRFDKRLKELDDEYKTTIVNFSKYKLVMYTMAKIMELEVEEQNKIALILFNSIKNKKVKI